MTELVLAAIGVAFIVLAWFAPIEPRWAGSLAVLACFAAGVFCIVTAADRAWG